MKSVYLFPLCFVLMVPLFWQCTPDSSQSLSEEMSTEIAMLPTESGTMGYLNVKSIKNSPFYSFVEENLEDNPVYSEEYQEFIEATGLDIRKDIDEIYFTFTQNDMEDDPSVFAVIKGNYKPERIMDYIMEEQDESEFKEEKFNDHTLYLIDDGEFAICFTDNNRLIAGNEKRIQEWLEKGNSDQTNESSEKTKKSIEALKYKKQCWMLMDAQKFVNEMMDEFSHRQSENFQGLKSLQSLNFSVHCHPYRARS